MQKVDGFDTLTTSPVKEGVRYLDDFSGKLGYKFKFFGLLVKKVDGFDT